MGDPDKFSVPIFIILLHEYHNGMNKEEALQRLLVSSEKSPNFFPRIDYRDVAFWFEKFGKGDFAFRWKPECDKLTQLPHTPALNVILNEATASDQMTLRQVCRTLRSTIDGDDRLFKEVRFSLSTNSIILVTKSVITMQTQKIIYTRRGDGCEIKNNEVITESDKNFIEEALVDFKHSVEKVNTKIEDLIITHNDQGMIPENQQMIILGISEALSKLKGKLNVESLEITITKPKDLEDVLSKLQPGSLKKLDIENTAEDIISIDEVMSLLDHWQYLESFETSRIDHNKPIDSFSHINNVRAYLASPTITDIVNYKNKLLHCPSFEDHQFYFDINTANLSHALQPFVPAEEFDENFDFTSVDGCFPLEGGGRIEFKIDSGDLAGIQFAKKNN